MGEGIEQQCPRAFLALGAFFKMPLKLSRTYLIQFLAVGKVYISFQYVNMPCSLRPWFESIARQK
jgi:hypothetical protein